MNLTNAVSLYPNPATTKVNVSAKESIKAITIFAITGEEVLKRKVDNKQSEIIPVGLLPKGLYSVRVTTASTTCNTLLYITG